MSLKNEIDSKRVNIRTDSYDMSIGEWINMYESKEIDIHPEFQRFFRWTDKQKSKFIESLLLGIPVPPIFVSQREDGVWDVIDGLQRLSTIFNFVGILKGRNDEEIPPFIPDETKLLPSLAKKKWDDPNNEENSLSFEQRLIIKRAKISVSIVLRESEAATTYELFQRINTGGSQLTEQEVRNCILVMENESFYQWLREEISDYESFQNCISLSEKNKMEQYDLELALRFMTFYKLDIKDFRLKDVGEFLTNEMIKIANNADFDKSEFKSNFKGTFDSLDAALGVTSFRRWDPASSKYKGGFLISPFEVIALGIGYNYPRIPDNDAIVEKVKQLYSIPEYLENSGSGTNAAQRIPVLLPLGRDLFRRK